MFASIIFCANGLARLVETKPLHERVITIASILGEKHTGNRHPRQLSIDAGIDQGIRNPLRIG